MSVDCMLVSILSVSVEALDMGCAEAAEALAHWAWDNLLPLHLMCDFRNPNLICIQFQCSVISFGARPDFDCVGLL